MFENGYIKFIKITSSLNENGNPVSEVEEESDFIPANIQGTKTKHLQNQSSNYEIDSYNIVVDTFDAEIYSDNIIVFDKQKKELGKFQVKSKKISQMFNSFSLVV